MNYPDRGATVYQDFIYLLYFVCTNLAILGLLGGLLFLVMLQYGYKSITIKFNKRNKLLKQIKHNEKIKEKSYMNRLENRVKKKK